METPKAITPTLPKADLAPKKKEAQKFVTDIKNDKVTLKTPLPPVFLWRSVRYVTANLTEQQILIFAQDSAFPHIVEKSANF